MKKIQLIVMSILISIISYADNKLKDFSIVLDWYPNAIHSFLYVAKDKGYFEEEGLNLIIHYPANFSDGITLTASKRANVGMAYSHSLIMVKSKESIPLVSIGALVQSPVNIVMALKEKNIKRPKDLEGKKIGYPGDNLSEAMIKTIIESDGGDPSKVEMIDVGFELLTATITKRVDATIGAVYNHEVPVMEDKGFQVDYFFPSEYGVPKYYEYIFIANKDMIEKDKDDYEGFLRAIKKAFKYTKENPNDAVEILLKNQEKDQFPLKKSVEEKSLKILLSIMENENNKFLNQDEKIWRDTIEWLYKEKIIKQKVDIKNLKK